MQFENNPKVPYSVQDEISEFNKLGIKTDEVQSIEVGNVCDCSKVPCLHFVIICSRTHEKKCIHLSAYQVLELYRLSGLDRGNFLDHILVNGHDIAIRNYNKYLEDKKLPPIKFDEIIMPVRTVNFDHWDITVETLFSEPYYEECVSTREGLPPKEKKMSQRIKDSLMSFFGCSF